MRFKVAKSLENQFIYPIPKGSKLIFFAPLGAGVNEENQKVHGYNFRYSLKKILNCILFSEFDTRI
jgi:hypothetical protein